MQIIFKERRCLDHIGPQCLDTWDVSEPGHGPMGPCPGSVPFMFMNVTFPGRAGPNLTNFFMGLLFNQLDI